MKPPMLEISFRNGRPFAAYVRLSGPRVSTARTSRESAGLLVDYGPSGEVLGLEIIAFDDATIDGINVVLAKLGHPALSARDLAPLRAA
jgi:hypothetical protein